MPHIDTRTMPRELWRDWGVVTSDGKKLDNVIAINTGEGWYEVLELERNAYGAVVNTRYTKIEDKSIKLINMRTGRYWHEVM